ncbi:MAG: hypothetical protein LAT55_13685 [Opitutales bacterium]|nr:hypothetical protein [Opitutales bacterium]
MFYTNIQRYGRRLLVRGYDNNGQQYFDRIKYRPKMYVPVKNESEANCRIKTIDGRPTKQIIFDDCKEAADYIKQYQDVHGYEVHGFEKFQYAYAAEQPWTLNAQLIRMLNFDIEVGYDDETGYSHPNEAKNPIYTIAVRTSPTDVEKHVFGWKELDQDLCKEEFVYHRASNEAEMLKDFISYWVDRMPDIVTGWNTEFFDIPYLINRISRLLGADAAKELSPWGQIREKTVKNKFNTKGESTFVIVGVSHLDYLALFKKFGKLKYGDQESYKLDHIAEVILGRKKVDYSEEGTLEDLYQNNFEKFVDYNVVDIDLIDDFEETTGFIKVATVTAYKASVNFEDTLGTIALWDAYIAKELKKLRKTPPPRKVDNLKTQFPGGYVKEVENKFLDWVVSFDLNSLYPNVIVQYNMSPETLNETHSEEFSMFKDLTLPKNPSKDVTRCPSGICFNTNEIGIFPHIIKSLYDERVQRKEAMLAAEEAEQNSADAKEKAVYKTQANSHAIYQQAVKLLLNSLYGAMGNVYFRYFDLRIAGSVTVTGQYVIKSAEDAVNTFLNSILENRKDRIVAIDTDSIYVDCSDVMKKLNPSDDTAVDVLNDFSKNCLEPILEKRFTKLAKESNAFEPRMIMKREVIADVGLWKAAKNYILNVLDSEGVRYKEPKLKIMGLAAIKSSTPKFVRAAYEKIFKLIMNKDEDKAQQFVQNFREEFFKSKYSDIAEPSSVNNLEKYSAPSDKICQSGTPKHVRGSLVYNYYLKKFKIQHKYPQIISGDKIKLLTLHKQNPFNTHVICYSDVLPPEFDIERYINKEEMFRKTFMNLVEDLLEIAGFTGSNTLDSFFS